MEDMGVQLGLEDWLEVRSGQQECFLGVKTLASVFRRPEPGTHIGWICTEHKLVCLLPLCLLIWIVNLWQVLPLPEEPLKM